MKMFVITMTDNERSVQVAERCINSGIKFDAYIKKHKERPNDERLEVIINEILNSGHTQKDDLTIVVIDSKN